MLRLLKKPSKAVAMYIIIVFSTLILVLCLLLFRWSLTPTQAGIILGGYSVTAILFTVFTTVFLRPIDKAGYSWQFANWLNEIGCVKIGKHISRNAGRYETLLDVLPFLFSALSIVASTVLLFIGTL